MKYNCIKYNDVANCPGIAVSIYLQGCDFRCRGCHNPEAWDFNGGQEFTTETLAAIVKGIHANNVERNVCILGGEPLHPKNIFLTALICKTIREKSPNTKIYIWTGYTKEDLETSCDPKIVNILNGAYADVLIDGPFIQELKDLTLEMRGSSNQRIIDLGKN